MPSYIDARSTQFAVLRNEMFYAPSDEDESDSDDKYYGFLAHDGTYIIMKQTLSTGAFRYHGGHDGYATAWTARTTHTYKYYNELP